MADLRCWLQVLLPDTEFDDIHSVEVERYQSYKATVCVSSSITTYIAMKELYFYIVSPLGRVKTAQEEHVL